MGGPNMGGPGMGGQGMGGQGMGGQGMGPQGMGPQGMGPQGMGGPGMGGPNMNGGALSGGVAMSSGGQGRATPDVQQMNMEGFPGNTPGQGQMGMSGEFGMQVSLLGMTYLLIIDFVSAARHECVDGSASVFRWRRRW